MRPRVGVRLRTVGVLLAVLMPVAAVAPGYAAAGPRTRSARLLSIDESAHLHLTSKSGFTLNEQGTASGTIAGTIYIHLHIANNRGGVTAEVSIYPRGGSLSGSGSATYQVDGAQALFSGTLSIGRGTGSYAGARASGLRFSGSIQRRGDAVAVSLSGTLSL